ncbi:cation:proton antiporter domain-containing protein [Oleiharenicola lentus]|uniref:cation:proton antiporter domain-containing protein n=1 Tax=Oleiharenicola lentus TaxID=2508720 RepID=UPI003F675863
MHGIDFIQDLAVVLIVAGLVGWLCHRIGLSVIVGFLGAGMLIGPFTPPFSLVTDVERIETLSQLGLVFLMFGIGLRLSFRRLRRMGLPLVFAVTINTLLIYYLTRIFGAAMHWNAAETLFLAAMLMVSSSAIIGKILVEVGVTHDATAQSAMSLSVVEDVVAVVMLTILSSFAKFDGGGSGGTKIGETIGVMGAFVVLAGVLSLLTVPWLLRRLSVAVSEELQTLCMAGLLLGLAVIAARAGYSLALGAFLLGCVVAETAQRTQVERTFEGLHDVFSAVFFVAIGMQIDIRMLGSTAGLIVVVAVFSLLMRPLVCTVGFFLSGTPVRDALRIGLIATPIGEFSLIIAQLGVSLAVVPAKFYPLAVGVALLTSLVAPLLTRHSEKIADALLARQPQWLQSVQSGYRNWLQRLQQRGRKNVLWQLSRKRLIQIGVEVLLVSGLLLFSNQLFVLVEEYLPSGSNFPRAAEIVFWGTLGLVTLVPLLAIWRNVSALAMIIADSTTQGHPRAAIFRKVVETGLKVAAGVAIFLWVSALVPFEGMGRWVPLIALLVAGIVVTLLRTKFVYWHSMMEVELQERLNQNEQKAPAAKAPWLAPHGDWEMALTECVLPDLADVRGRTLDELGLRTKFGVVVAGVDRQGVMLGNPAPSTALYPGDRVLLLGEPKQIAAAKTFLRAVSGVQSVSDFEDVRMDSVQIPEESAFAGKTLAELALGKIYGLQVAGINRAGVRLLNPSGTDSFSAGDDVLVLGSSDQIELFKNDLRK